MKVYKVDITPRSVFKDIPSSYTIFGAICWAYRILYGKDRLNDMLIDFENRNIPFLVSSFMPKVNGKYYFPRPNLKAQRKDSVKGDYKRLKKISYVEFDIFKRVLDAEIKTEFELNEALSNMSDELSKISIASKYYISRASIDRINSTIDGSGQLYFEEVVGLTDSFMLVAVKDNEVEKELKAVFRLLEDINIGGNRSIGYGKVVFGDFQEFEELEAYFNTQTDTFISLAPVIPEPATYDLENSYYQYFTFRGAIDNDYDFKDIDIWKDKVIYLQEGSVFHIKSPKTFYGTFYKAKDLKGNTIFQYGLSFPLFIQKGAIP